MTPKNWEQIRQVKGYETSDGRVFASAKIAMLEQVEINLKASLGELVSEFCYSDEDTIVAALIGYRSRLTEIFLAYSELKAQAEAMR